VPRSLLLIFLPPSCWLLLVSGAWDCVATCFFLDTAHNVVEYLDIIHRILVPGGVWVNLGPLSCHHSDASPAPLGLVAGGEAQGRECLWSCLWRMFEEQQQRGVFV